MELVVLGVGGGWPRTGGAACGYLFRHEGFNLWVDAGTGTMANLQRHVGLEDVHAVAISHRHFDHFLDLYPFWLSRWGRDTPSTPPPVPLFAPPGMFEHAAQLQDDLARGLDPRVVEPGTEFEAGPFRVRTALMRHPVPTMGMRVEAGGAAVAYSADTAACDELVALARGADALLCEATFLDEGDGSPDIHLSAEQAGAHAAMADVPRLILTHIWPVIDRAASAERAGRAFGGQIQVAEEGQKLRW